MSYGRYADYDDEPSRRQPLRDERGHQSRYDDIPSTPTQRTFASEEISRQSTRDVPIPFRNDPPPPPRPRSPSRDQDYERSQGRSQEYAHGQGYAQDRDRDRERGQGQSYDRDYSQSQGQGQGQGQDRGQSYATGQYQAQSQPQDRAQVGPTSTRGFALSPPTESFAALSTASRSIAGGEGVEQSVISHPRGIEAVERRLRSLKPSPFAVRPGHGSAGKALTVKTNYFQVRPWNNEPPKIIHHYDVEIDPHVKVLNQKKPKALLRAVWEQLVLEQKDELWVEPFSASAFDGRKNAYTPIEFPLNRDNSQTFSVAVNTDGIVQKPGQSSGSEDEQRRWRITIKHVACIDLEAVIRFCKANEGSAKVEEECLTALMATNVLLRDVPSKKYAQVGASGNRFFSSEGAVPIAHGAVVCKGFMQSFRYSSCGLPVLNLDVGYSAFLASGPAVDVIAKIIGMPAVRGRGGYMGGIQPKRELTEMSERDIARAKSKLRGAKFTVNHRKSTRLHTIQSITLMGADKIFFALNGKDGQADRKISIVQYFEEFHGSKVTRPRLPCIQYGKKAYVPLEFVELTEWNSLPPLKLSPDQTAEMIKISAVKPPDRCAQIVKWRQGLAYEQQDKIRQWGLQINKNLMKVPARILPPPSVMYARNQDARPIDGSWNLRGKEFFRNGPQPLKAWAVISFDKFTNPDEMKRYMLYLMQTLERHGVKIENEQPTLIGPVDPTKEQNVKSALQSAARAAYQAGQCAPQLIFIILPGRDAFLYEQIKRLSFMDLKAPVPTQCMQAAKIRAPRSIEAYTGNLVMKVQAKLGGVTHQVPIRDLPGMVRGKTMLLGGNLGFPPTRFGQFEGAPTVACTIATYNADCDAYSAQIRLQEGRSEFIMDLSSMIQAHLTIFTKHNDGTYPDRILIFRDGISEGQYAPVLAYENDAVIRACAKIQAGYRPKILICVCAKRHSTRFFGEPRDIDTSGNLHSGLVVDQGVTHPYAFDFFMQSQQGRVGTARPTHYVCLLDEIGVSPDELQRMVHSLCFTFARCTKSVSLVPVCYIADLVCQKARIIVHEPNLANSAPSESSHGGTNTTRSMFRRPGGDLDVMQVQRVLEKNAELELVGWWM